MNNLGYVLGVMLGDGSLYRCKSHYTIALEAVDKNFAQRFKAALSRLSTNRVFFYYYERKLCIYGRHSDTKYYRVKLYDKNLFLKFQTLKSAFMKETLPFNKAFVKSLIKGFYDSEGCLCNYKDKYWYVNFTNKDQFLLEKISDCLKNLGVSVSGLYHRVGQKGTERWDSWQLYIYRQEEVQKFLKIIGENSGNE
jgi:intein-encoded DNA endonuclease-like protein